MRADYISSFPDQILFRIISLTPFESARQTICLSRRWKLLWETAIDCCGTEHDVASSISDFLANFNEHDPVNCIRKFKFYIGNNYGNDILFSAITCPNGKFHLDFSSGVRQANPCRKFGLDLEFDHHPSGIINQPTSLVFPIRSLNLVSVNVLTGEAVSCIARNFPFLETLKITSCKRLESLTIGSDKKLQSLTIFDCPDLHTLQIRSFKLKTLRYRGKLPWIQPQYLYHFNLVDCFLDARQGPGLSGFTSRDFDPFLLTIKNAKVLTLSKWIVQVLILPSLAIFASEFQFYNLKELWWIDDGQSNQEDDDAYALISFLKLCPSLEQLFVTVDSTYVCRYASKWSMQAGKNTKLTQLKMIKLEGFKGDEEEIQLLDRISELIISNPIIFSSPSDVTYWRQLVRSPFFNQPEGNRDEAAKLLTSKSLYKIIPIQKTTAFFPNHAHMVL